jgi:L-serine dehydratase
MIVAFETTIKAGLKLSGKMPGIVAFDRRAKTIYDSISKTDTEFVKRVKSVSAYAMATNEEAVIYGFVVTAPTCGSAGTLPAVYK